MYFSREPQPSKTPKNDNRPQNFQGPFMDFVRSTGVDRPIVFYGGRWQYFPIGRRGHRSCKIGLRRIFGALFGHSTVCEHTVVCHSQNGHYWSSIAHRLVGRRSCHPHDKSGSHVQHVAPRNFWNSDLAGALAQDAQFAADVSVGFKKLSGNTPMTHLCHGYRIFLQKTGK